MKKQTFIVEIEMPDGDMVSPGWLQDLIQQDCDNEKNNGRQTVSVRDAQLPSNLDEAANDYCSAYYDWDNEGERRAVVGTFKAGAEWMAGQGVTKNGFVSAYANGFLRVYTPILDQEDGIKFGDKVVVQIRKKQ